ncbi:MAG: Ig-like domain-containing protein [bacterium]|nr:Ig-like domain-containing protein [bacterium]
MKGVEKKDKILVTISVLVLFAALVQLGVLVYKSYNPTANEGESVVLIVTEQKKSNIQILSDNEEFKLDERNSCVIEVGTEIEIKVVPDENYGIYSIALNDENLEVSQPHEFVYKYTIEKDTTIDLEIKKMYTIRCKYTGRGSGKCKINQEQIVETENTYIFENESISLSFLPEEYSEINKIEVNNVNLTISNVEKKEYIYKIDEVKKDIWVEVEFNKQFFLIEVLDNDFNIWMNNKQTRKIEVEANQECRIKIEAKSKNQVIDGLYCNSEKKYWADENSRSLEYVINNVNENVSISLKSTLYDDIDCDFETVFDVLLEDGLNADIKKIIKSDGHVILIFNKQKKLKLTTKKDWLIKPSKISLNGTIFIENSCLFDCIYLRNTQGSMNGVYQYPIQFIFDTIAPTASSYKVTHSAPSTSDSTLTISTKITDQGDSEIDTVQFGTKEEYDKSVSTDVTQKNYDYKLENNNNNYIFSVKKTSLKDEEYYIWATDNATNRSEPMKVDVAGPTLTVDTESKWFNQDITVRGVAKDKGSNVEHVYYSVDKSEAENHMAQNQETKSIKKATLNKETGEYSFQVDAKQSGKTTYYIWAYDTMGNKSEQLYSYVAMFDVKKPVMKLVSKKPNQKWHNDIVTIAFSARDYDQAGCSGIEKVYYSIGDNQNDMTELSVNKDENDSYVIQSPVDEDKNAIDMEDSYYIYAEDKAGNISLPLKVEVNIDTNPAKITEVMLSKKVGDTTENVQSLKHGTYLNEPLLVEVTATDLYQLSSGAMTKASGIKSIMLLCDGEQIASKTCEKENYKDEFKVVFQIPAGFKGNLSLMTCDQVGNQSTPVSISAVNSVYNDYICIEATSPKLKITSDSPVYTDAEKREWYAEDQILTFDCSDEEAGLKQLQVKVNGQTITNDLSGNNIQIQATNEKVCQTTFKIDTQQIGESEDGKYNVVLSAVDNAGNIQEKSKTIYIDRVTPVIEQFSFTANGIKDRDERLIEKQEYGYYFNEPTKVQIKASDGTPSSGIRAIEYYTVDYSSNKDGVASKKTVKEVGQDNTVFFTIRENFKGQIFARAVDYVEHTASKFSRPYGIIIDSSAGGISNSQIAFSTPDTECKDNKGNQLYKENVDVNLDVANYYSGIRSIEWEVDSKQDSASNQSGKLTVSSTGKLEGDTSYFNLEESDQNLVTRLKGKLVISNNSNNIRIHVVVTDRTGTEYEKEMYLSIDKTAPILELTFDKKNSSVYYNQPRIATIKVRERNFDAEQVKLELYNAAGEVPKLSAWSKQEDSENPDQTVNIATIEFDKDGIYSLKALVKDKVGNEGRPSQTETFTIDQTEPVLDVLLPTPSYKEGGISYYNSTTKVQLNISENNFEFSNVKVEGTAINEGKKIAFPELGITSSSRQQYNLELEFVNQGSYTFTISYADEAGNTLEKQETIKLVIDKVSPEVKITGVKDQMCYNGDLIPEIMCTDNNFTSTQTEVKLYDAMENEVKFTPQRVKVEKGITYRLDCFPKKKEYDKIYKLVVSCTDKASNVTTKEVHFSINRFGSTYSFSDALLNVAGKYVKDEFDLVVTEINVNKLSTENTVVRLVCNDNVKDLVKDQDYSVTEDGGEGTWYEYIYHISSNLIQEDGKYSLAIYSKDEAGNINENTDEDKKAEIWFGIDRTPPRIVPINVAAGSTYNETTRKVKINVEDNLVLDHAKIYVNEQEVPYSLEQNQYIVQVGSSNSAQSIKVVAMDQAGNEATKEIKKIFITTNLLVRIANDRSFWAVGIIGVLIVSLGSSVLFIVYRKRKKIEQQ